MARTYNESLSVFLAGPIEYWWDTPEDPNRFYSHAAREYRRHRDDLSEALAEAGFLVYRPHMAFKGDWNEKMQPVNDYVISLSDIVIDMSPPGIPGAGTKHEMEYAEKLGKQIYICNPRHSIRSTILLILALNKNKVQLNSGGLT